MLTPDHKVFTQRGWVKAKDLKPTDKIITHKKSLLDKVLLSITEFIESIKAYFV